MNGKIFISLCLASFLCLAATDSNEDIYIRINRAFCQGVTNTKYWACYAQNRTQTIGTPEGFYTYCANGDTTAICKLFAQDPVPEEGKTALKCGLDWFATQTEDVEKELTIIEKDVNVGNTFVTSMFCDTEGEDSTVELKPNIGYATDCT